MLYSIAGPLLTYFNNDGTDLADVVSKVSSDMKIVLDEAREHEDGLLLVSCIGRSLFLSFLVRKLVASTARWLANCRFS